jgi:acylphosphatase
MGPAALQLRHMHHVAKAGYNVLMRVARRFLVSGRVQGVGFRFFAADAARREGLAGSVRNLDDGRVEAIAEGESESVTRFERALRQGPSRARVEYVQVEDIDPLTTHGFTVE